MFLGRITEGVVLMMIVCFIVFLLLLLYLLFLFVISQRECISHVKQTFHYEF